MTPARKSLAAAVADLLEIGIWLVDAGGKTIYRNAPMAALAPGVESLADLAAYMPEVPVLDYLQQLHGGDPAIIETRVRRIGAEGRTARLRFAQVPAFQPARPSLARAGSFTLIIMEEVLEKPASDPVIEAAVRTSAICHEVNNPLAILSGQVELLAREQSDLESRVSTMQGAVGRIADVVRRLHRAAEVLKHAPRPVKAKTKEKAA